MKIQDFIQKAINRKTYNPDLQKAFDDLEFQRAIYSGKGHDDIIFNYRKNESPEQKSQRKRIYIPRTKHIIKQIDNVLNQLNMMDSPTINIISKNEEARKFLLDYIYNYDLSDLAFNSVKNFGALIDANAFIKFGENAYGDYEFKVVSCKNLYDFYVVNGKLKCVIFKFTQKMGTEVKNIFEAYEDDKITIYSEFEEGSMEDKWGTYFVKTIKTKVNYVFPLGFISNIDATDSPIKLTLLEFASELFRSLIWQGSELDVIKGTHGIYKQFSFAPECNYRIRTGDGNDSSISKCVGGYLYVDNTMTDQKCPECLGSGLKIHTSSQDLITFPFPRPGENLELKLSDLTHTVYVDSNLFEALKTDIRELKSDIMSTVFNNSNVVKNEIDQVDETATKSIIDLQGVYATLNILGKHTSNCFIWMIECLCDAYNYTDVQVLHGYSLTLKLETIEDLAKRRKILIETNSPLELIRAIDLAMMQKRHLDDPGAVNRYTIWEQYKPFPDKSDNSILSFLSPLPDNNFYKIWYNFWGQIKRNIEKTEGDKFYTYNDDKRMELIKSEIIKISENLDNREQNSKVNIDPIQ